MRRSAVLVALLLVSASHLVAAEKKRTLPVHRELGRQDSSRIVRLIGVQRGDSVAAIGAGSSFLLQELSRAAGTNGKVFVVDWDATAIQGVRKRIEDERLDNVTPILAGSSDLLLPDPVKRQIFVNSYALIEDRENFFASNRKYLTRDGTVAVIDYYRRPMKIGPPLKSRVASHRVTAELRRFGYSLVDRHNVSSFQYFLVYRARARAKTSS